MTGNAAPHGAISLDVLGRLSLRAGADEVRPVLAQPKRLALLVYLTLRDPGGFVRRDELLGVFWPEAREDRARASLRQALRFLRLHLGADLVVSRGSAEVGIRPDGMACDAVALLRASEAGRSAAALDAYAGDLLPGFILAGAYEFDRWLHAERQRLRTAALRAALQVADAAEARGDAPAGVGALRRALALEPLAEGVARRLIALLGRAGDRAGATAAFEELSDRLREELDLEPSPETVELVEAVKAGGAAQPGGPRPATLSPNRVLVTAFDDLTGDPSLAPVSRLAADALAQGLATLDEIEVVPPLAALGAAPSPGDGAGDAGSGSGAPEVARKVGAGTLVGGTCYLEDGRLRVQARITDVAGGRLLDPPDPVDGPASSPLSIIETLRDRVMVALAMALTRRTVHPGAAMRPPGMPAYRAYLRGLELFIAGEWRHSLEHFRAATRLEPDYALPAVVSAIALWNLGDLAAARAAADQAADLRATLGRFERAVLDMVLAWLEGDWAAAHRAARVQADIAPGSIPHFQVAEEARRLNRPRAAREVLSRLDPEAGELSGWIFYWVELATAHHLLGEHGRELDAASRCRGLHPDEPLSALLEIRALAALRRPDDVGRVLERALATPSAREPTPGALLLEGGLELAAHGEEPAGAALLDRAVDWYRERLRQDGAEATRRHLARALYYAGQRAAARVLFLDLAQSPGAGVHPVGHHHGHLQGHLDEGVLAALAAGKGDDAELGRRVARLESLRGPFLYGAQWLWLARVAAVRGDRDLAVSLLRRAFADGLPREMFLHTDPDLRRLRGHPPFDRLMRPAG